MFNNKPRVLIRAFTCRRDVASASLLAKCLEYLGCEVKIATVRNYDTNLKLWRPDVAVFNVLNVGPKVKKINPNIKTVFLDGEGFQPDEYAHSITLTQKPFLVKPIDMVLVWGQSVFSEIKNIFHENGCKKVHVVGWPTLDFIKFRNKKH